MPTKLYILMISVHSLADTNHTGAGERLPIHKIGHVGASHTAWKAPTTLFGFTGARWYRETLNIEQGKAGMVNLNFVRNNTGFGAFPLSYSSRINSVWMTSLDLPIYNLCYTDIDMEMNSLSRTRLAWPAWSGFLRKYGLENFAAFLLEAAGPLSIVGAQLLHFTGPFLPSALNANQRDALANLLEDRQESTTFAAYLREDTSL